MMTNLFSMFDPATNFIFKFSLNWSSLILLIFLLPIFFWLIPNNFNLIFLKLIDALNNEFKVILKKKDNNFNLMFITLFMLILINNFMGLFPFIFTSTSHLSINLSLTFPLWMGMMLYGWINKTNHMFTHLVPQGTPNLLIPFMILIESISNMIRPITLTIRLTANMIAGHLLITLLSSLGPKLINLMIPFLLIIQLVLFLLEAAVAMIQSYVFAILLTLYFNEI